MKKQRITEKDYLKAHRKASREEEIARHGRTALCRAVHKSKKTYDRQTRKGRSQKPAFFISYPCVSELRRQDRFFDGPGLYA